MNTKFTMKNALIKTIELGKAPGTIHLEARMPSLDLLSPSVTIEKELTLDDMPNYIQKAVINSDEAPLKTLQDLQGTMKLLPVRWFFPEDEEA